MGSRPNGGAVSVNGRAWLVVFAWVVFAAAFVFGYFSGRLYAIRVYLNALRQQRLRLARRRYEGRRK